MDNNVGNNTENNMDNNTDSNKDYKEKKNVLYLVFLLEHLVLKKAASYYMTNP